MGKMKKIVFFLTLTIFALAVTGCEEYEVSTTADTDEVIQNASSAIAEALPEENLPAEEVLPEEVVPEEEIPAELSSGADVSSAPSESSSKKPEQEKNVSPSAQAPAESAEEEDESNDFANRILALCNEERAKVGAAPLSLDTKLQNAAVIRADEIKTSFDHKRPNGQSYSTVLEEAGITGISASGENIAWGYPSPESVVEGWMDSAGHRANILNANYTHLGVGQNGTHWVQLFIKK